MELKKICHYRDDAGNTIFSETTFATSISVLFAGRNNRLEVDKDANLGEAVIQFMGNNALVRIGKGTKKKLCLLIKAGEDAQIILGNGLTSEKKVLLFASEGAAIKIGKDCMFASGVQIRADDAHPIFYVSDGKRANPSRDIIIGDHCWVAFGACILKGTHIGSGSVVATMSVVTGRFPNNCICGGSPARLLKTDIIWGRPNLAILGLAYKQHISQADIDAKYIRPTILDISLEDKMRYLWKGRKSHDIIDIYEQYNEKTPLMHYFCGLALYNLKRYAEALRCFSKYSVSSHTEFRDKIYFCMGNTFFNMENYISAKMSYEKAYKINPFDMENAAFLISCYILLASKCDTKDNKTSYYDILEEISKFLKSQELSLVLLNIENKIRGIATIYEHKKFQTIASQIFYPTEYRIKDGSDICYVFIQPLIDKDFLFKNRKFDCSVLFIKAIDYCYFMPFSEELLCNIGKLLKNYSKVVISSTSAGGFFAVVIGAYLAKLFSEMEVTVHAFSPQTLAINNDNLVNVTHYKRTNFLTKKFPFILEAGQKRSNLAEILGQYPYYNLKVHIYYGDKENVDRVEAARIIDSPYVEQHVLEEFPFHSSMVPYRYDENGIKKVFSSLAILPPPTTTQAPKISYSIEQ